AAALMNGGFPGSDGTEQRELGQGGDPVIQANLLDDLAVLELEDGDAGEVHRPARVGGQSTGQEVVEGRTGVSTAALPLADDVVSLGDEVSRAPEVEIGERCTEIGHEGLYVAATFPWFVQRVSQQHVRCGDLIDHAKVAGFVPEVGEPAADDRLVVILQAHASAFQLWLRRSSVWSDNLGVCVANPGRVRTPVLAPVSDRETPQLSALKARTRV